MKLSEAAYGGAEYISKYGHTKWDYVEADCLGGKLGKVLKRGVPACMMGGMMGYAEQRGLDSGSIAFKVETQAYRLGILDGSVAEFNDAPGTTAEDAILKLKEIGKALEEEGL